MKEIIMPLLSFTLGIIALLKDPKDPTRKKLINSSLVVALILTCVLEIYFKHQDQIQSKLDRDWSAATITNLSESLVKFQSSTEGNFREVKEILAPIFYRAGATQQAVANFTPAQVTRGLEANSELRSAAAGQQTGERNNVQIQYFYKPEDVNPDKIRDALQELGFKVKVQDAKNNLATNSIWYGNPVKIDDVKLVAYTLMRAGVQIRQIRHFSADVSKMNATIMQVGADPAMLDAEPYTIDQIRNGQFSR